MRRPALSWTLGLIIVSALVYWIGSNTEWVDVTVPMPPTGEAAENPFYAAGRFAEALGARSTSDRQFAVPDRDAVIVLSAWHWDLTETRRYALERWVESGGRLVVAGPLAGGGDEFERWSGVVRRHRPPARPAPGFRESCQEVKEEPAASSSAFGPRPHLLCNIDETSWLTTTRKPAWQLRNDSGVQVMRVVVGRGSVTVINGTPFQFSQLLAGDHGWLFVAATALRPADDVHFLTENDHPSLLTLMWRYGAPAIVLALGAIGFALWRTSTRFGPLAEPQSTARRSLAEQIRGTGQFALRHGDGESLHEAAVRALTEAATRRIPGYAGMSPGERAGALADVTSFDRNAINAAVHHAGLRGARELRGTLAFLETARREILRGFQTQPGHEATDPWNSLKQRF